MNVHEARLAIARDISTIVLDLLADDPDQVDPDEEAVALDLAEVIIEYLDMRVTSVADLSATVTVRLRNPTA